MKSLRNKLLILVLVVSMTLSIFSCVVYANPEETDAALEQESVTDVQDETSTTENESGEGSESTAPEAQAFDQSVDNEFDYKAYRESIKDTATPVIADWGEYKAEDAVQFDKTTGEIIGTSADVIKVKKASDNNENEIKEGALFAEEGIYGWVIDVPQSGWYNITFSYLAYETLTYTDTDGNIVTIKCKKSAVQRRVYIDYKVPFYEARQVNLERVWKDKGVLQIHSETQNEKRPYQVGTNVWQEVALRDYMGYEVEPFKFYLEEGKHVLAFEAIKEGMLVEKINIHQIADAKPYSEVKQDYVDKGYSKVTDTIYFIQAEGIHNPEAYTEDQAAIFANAELYNESLYQELKNGVADVTYDILKSSPTLYAITDRSSPSTVPYHHSKIRYNTIGADKWQAPNDWIEWTVRVDKEGLYAISFKARQNTLSGLSTTRKLTVNGEVPCAEVENLVFNYGNSFEMYTPKTEDGETILFYLNKGENKIRLESTLGRMGDFLAVAENSLTRLNLAYRKILMITGATPDTNKSYMLDALATDALKILLEEYINLKDLKASMMSEDAYGEEISAQLTSLDSMILLLGRMMEDDEADNDKLKIDHTVVPSLFTNLKDSIAAMGTWINDMSQNPLELDYFVITSEDKLDTEDIPDADAGFFAKLLHEIRSFIASFTEDYDNIGGTVAQDGQEPVIVWLETGAGLTGSRDNATILKQLIDDKFTAETGVAVSTRLVAGGSLLPSVLSGIGPEVCLSRGAVDAINYAFRGAVMNLANDELFPNWRDVLATDREGVPEDEIRYKQSAVDPFTFGNGIYAIPETQDFFMTFYRTDILEELGLEPPETWQEVYNIIGHLQNKQMTFAMPVPVVGAVGSGNNTFATLLYQKGGQYYTDERDSTLLTSDAALNAFKEWTEFYTLYNLPNTYDFANRFRTGEVPIGIASYSQYSQLAVFAPEIQGLWEFSLVPGTIRTDENGETYVDHSCASSTSGCVMLSMPSETEEERARINRAWQFMTWWTGEDAQSSFGTEIESLLGAAARYQTANLQAMKQLPWDKQSMDTIQEQWNWCKAIPQVPGGYYTARNVEFAWKEVINNPGVDPNTTFVEYVGKIDREIDRKREEFKTKIEQMMG